MKEKFKIEIESKGEYDVKKEFKKEIELTERQFLSLISAILDFEDLLPKETVKQPYFGGGGGGGGDIPQ